MTRETTTPFWWRPRANERVTRARWLALIATLLCAPVGDSNPAVTGFDGVVCFADGEPFTIVRRDTLMSGSKGVAVIAGDLIETGPGVLLVIQGPQGNLIGIGPSTAVYFVERGEATTLFVRKGWVKGDIKSGSMRVLGTRLGIQGHQAVMLLHADERTNAAFDEQGASAILLPAAAALVSKETGPNHFFLRERLELLSQPSPSAEFVEKMPIAFRDPLPGFLKTPEPVAPRVLRAVTYSDIEAWLTIPREWRSGFVGRFRSRLNDPAFFAAMDAHKALFPEWVRILHPPLTPESGHAPAQPSEGNPAPHDSDAQRGDESR